VTNIFKTRVEMPPKDNSNDPLVVRTAQTMADMHKNYLPAALPQDRSVENITRPRRGHDY
jgi:hypothetical protein